MAEPAASSAKPPFYITTPIYYVNDVPHIGHAYTSLACDAIARFWRLDGRPVHFLTGTDEHGQKIQRSAAARGMDPQAFCDQVSANFRHLAQAMGFSNDDFIRTTEERHKRAVQALWNRLVETGNIYEATYTGWYSVRDEAYYDEAELREGPDGAKLAPTGAPVEWVEEPSFFFRLSDWGDKLLAFYDANPDFIGPKSRRNEVVSFVKGGLRDLSLSRTTVSWGIPVPGSPGHTVYVWLDALTNYLSAVGYPDVESPLFKWWPASLHVVGKDIIRFHAVYWPAFLMAAGLPTPKRVFAHGWWTNEGQKISKSLGNVIDPLALVEKYGLDQTRYFLLREVPFGQDGDFSHRAMVGRINGDLANDLGNLAQRTLSQIARNCDGKVPAPGALTPEDEVFLAQVDGLYEALKAAFETQELHIALTRLWAVISQANGYIANQAPWSLKKTDPARMGTVLWVVAEALRQFALLCLPIMPASAADLLAQVGEGPERHSFALLGAAGRLVPGRALPPPQGIFPRVREDEPAPAEA